MKKLILGRDQLVIAGICGLFLLCLLSALSLNPFQILNIFGFLFLVIVPGSLTIFTIQLKDLDLWDHVGLMAGFSIFELVSITLLGNTLLPLFGIAQPLSKTVLLYEVSILVLGLLAIAWSRGSEVIVPIKKYFIFENTDSFLFAVIPVIFVVMSVFGAIQLNDGGTGIITTIMLVGIAIYSAFLVFYRKELEPDAVPSAFFFISLSLLFMTSLRGWSVTGHDIQREYQVFQLTKNSGIWSIASFRDAYNACMSITILPTIFANILDLFDPYVFKVLFQILFAVLPGILYSTTKRYVEPAIAFLATFYFIAFPTFFTDMPFINRQEIAFLFLGLMIYSIFNTNFSLKIRRVLFVIFGVGMVLSHYSTTYTVIAILLFLAIVRPLLTWIMRHTDEEGWFSRSAVSNLGKKDIFHDPLITISMIAILTAATFLWSSVLTNTASNSLYRVISETISVIESNTKEDAKSGDVSYSLLSWQPANLTEIFKNYKEDVVAPARATSTDLYYSAASYSGYPLVATPGDSLPTTFLGKLMEAIGINVAGLNYILRQGSAKLLQLFILIGFMYILFRKRFFQKPLHTEYILLAIGSLVFIAAQVILPVLSLEYGVLRAFQQSLMFLGLFIVIGSLVIAIRLGEKFALLFATVIAVVFFLSSSGATTQIFGGYDPQLSLDNTGLYYDIYYLHNTDTAGINWFNGIVPQGEAYSSWPNVQADMSLSPRLSPINDIKISGDIYPGLIRKDSYVLLDFTNIQNKQTTISYEGNYITYDYPIQFLNNNKNLIYNNGSFRVYR